MPSRPSTIPWEKLFQASKLMADLRSYPVFEGLSNKMGTTKCSGFWRWGKQGKFLDLNHKFVLFKNWRRKDGCLWLNLLARAPGAQWSYVDYSTWKYIGSHMHDHVPWKMEGYNVIWFGNFLFFPPMWKMFNGSPRFGMQYRAMGTNAFPQQHSEV